MKKLLTTAVTIVLASTMSAGAFAYGSGGTMGGSPSLTAADLQPHWNGKAGQQNTPIAGIVAGWKADVCGTLNGKVTDTTECGADTEFAKRQGQ